MDGSKTRVSIDDAARLLGISPDGVRKRVRRGTLAHVREGGRIWVLLDSPKTASNTVQDEPETVSDSAAGTREARLEAEVATLRTALARSQEGEAELRRLLAGLMARLPELAAPAEETSGRREDVTPVTPAPSESSEPRRRPWWRRWRL